jgi:hypothetical protein
VVGRKSRDEDGGGGGYRGEVRRIIEGGLK